MSKFNVSFSKLSLQLIPNCLQGKKMKAFIKAIISPLTSITDDFREFRTDTDYRIAHNSQVCFLRAVLNDKFDDTLRGITITDGDELTALTLHKRETSQFLTVYQESEEKPVTMYCRLFNGSKTPNFKVNIPTRLKDTINLYSLRATIDEYKLAGSKYEIKYI